MMLYRPYFDAAIYDAGLETKAVMTAYSLLVAHLKTNSLDSLKELDDLNMTLYQIKSNRRFESFKSAAAKRYLHVGFRCFCEILLPQGQVKAAMTTYVNSLKNAQK